MFIVSKSLLISSAIAGGAIWLNPLLQWYLVYIVSSLYSVVLRTRVACMCAVCLLLCKKNDLLRYLCNY